MKKATIIHTFKMHKNKLDKITARPCSNTGGELIIVRHQKGSTCLYMKDEEGEHYMRTKRDEQKIRELAQLRYETALFRAAIDEKAAVEKCIRILESCKDTDKVFDEMPDELKPYITPDILTDKGYARKWQRERVESARRRQAILQRNTIQVRNLLPDEV